ncbi:MAG: HIT domain-containing protein, partial [Gemmatimonadales bacterium]
DQAADPVLLGRLLLMARDLARQEGIAEAGYRVVVNTNAAGGQTVFHLHLHLLGGRGMRWPPG